MTIFGHVAGFSNTVLIAGAPLPSIALRTVFATPRCRGDGREQLMFSMMELTVLLIFTVLIMALYIYRKAHNEKTHNKG